MRAGKPTSFGWLMIQKGIDIDLDLWELPTGYRIALERGVWLQDDGDGYLTAIEASTPTPPNAQPPGIRPPDAIA